MTWQGPTLSIGTRHSLRSQASELRVCGRQLGSRLPSYRSPLLPAEVTGGAVKRVPEWACRTRPQRWYRVSDITAARFNVLACDSKVVFVFDALCVDSQKGIKQPPHWLEPAQPTRVPHLSLVVVPAWLCAA